MIPVVLTPRPMAEPETMTQPAGRTVRAMLKEAVETGRIEAKYLGQAELHVDGVIIPRDEALDHVLEEDQIVNLVVYPHGGGGGGGKDVGQILLQVAVIAVSMWVGGGAGGAITNNLFARVAAAAVMVAGNMAISAIYAPKQTAEKANDRYALQSASNSYRQWGMMPLILGPCVIAPDLAVKTFTRAIGDDVWIYGILAHHYGPCRLDDLKIGDTLVSSMGAADVKFVHHLTPGPRTFSLVPNDIDQVDLAPEELVATPTSATPVVRASASEGEQFDLDFYLPGGLYFQKDDGRKIAASVTITVRYRKVDQFGAPVGSGAWTQGLTVPLTGSSKDPLRLTRTLNLPMGRYEFEVKRSVLEDTNEKRHTDVAWSAIRAITFRKPVTDEVLSISEFAIRATALNQGSLAPITAKVTPLCPTWTGTEWGPPVPTANPAALTRWLLTGPAPAKRLLSPQADAGLRAWSQLCDQYGWEAHVPVMEDRTQSEVMALLERAGRASIFWDGTQVIGSAWVEKPVPKQMFTGVNLKDHQFEIAYADPVHAFRVEFQNLEQRGEADEIMVYNDGYAEFAGVDEDGRPVAAATLIEALRLDDGQKTPERAYRDARWELGRRKHQRRFDTWSTDIEAVVCRYGNRVRLAWSRAGGEGGARVRTRRWSDGEGSTVTGLRLDREVEMSPGVDYVVDVRLVDQLITGVPVVNPAQGEPVVTREIVFVDARSGALSPRRGDMVAFGPAEQVTEDVEILGLEPGEGLTANLTGVRYVAPLLMAGETGPIPELQTRLSLDRQKDPPAPTLLGVQMAPEGVRVGFSMPPWRGSPLTGYSARWRVKPAVGETVGWTPLPDLGAGSMTLTTPPLAELPGEDDVTRVEIEIYALTAAGGVSKPLTVTASLPTVVRPDEDTWSLAARAVAADGSSQPVLVVSGAVADPAVSTVSIQYGLTANGPWVAEFNGPPPVVEHEIKGLSPAVNYYVLVTYYSVQGMPGRSLVLGPRAAPNLVAGDTVNIGGRPTPVVVQQLDDILIDVDALTVDVGEALEQATEAKVLAASSGYPSMNPNPVYAKPWESGVPPEWVDWGGGGAGRRAAGVESGNGFQMDVPATGSAQAANRGIFQPGGVGKLNTASGGSYYVAELTIRLDAGLLNGAGMLVQFYNASGGSIGSAAINASGDEPLGGPAPGTGVVGKVYRYAKLFKTEPGTTDLVPYAMAFWDGFYGQAVGKTVTITKSRVRPADPGEIEQGKARGSYPTLDARLTDQNTALVSATSALSLRQSMTEARATTLPNRLRNSDASLKMRYWTAGGSGALWSYYDDANFGTLFGALGGPDGADYFLISDLVAVYPNSTATLSFEGDGGTRPGEAYAYVSQFDAAGNYIPAGDGLGFINFVGVNWTTRKSTTFTTRSDCAYVKVVFQKKGGPGFNAFVSRIMLSTGATVVGWTDAATAKDIGGRVETSEGVLATVTGRVQAWFQKIVQAGDGTAFIQAKAIDDNGNVTSEVNLGARKIGMFTQVGNGWVEVLKLIGTSAHFAGKVFLGALQQITFDPDIPALIFTPPGGSVKMLYGAGFGVSSDCIMWLGPKTTDVSQISRTNGNWAFGTDGKVYYGTAELGTGGGGGGAGSGEKVVNFAGQLSNNTNWTTVGSITFPNRAAMGYWRGSMYGQGERSGSTNGASIEGRLIESGASAALATTSQGSISGEASQHLLEIDFLTPQPWPQTRPAGDITVLLQMRHLFSPGGFTNLSGSLNVSYTPSV